MSNGLVTQIIGAVIDVEFEKDNIPQVYEALLIEEILGVPPMVGTVSFGSPYVGAGVCASNNGAVAGTETTGPELNRLEDALGLI